MSNIKPIEDAADKWVRRASVSAVDYEKGINNPKKDWSKATSDAENNYKQGVSAAVAAGRFAKGVKAAGSEKWKSNAIAKGPTRFSEGVTIAKGEWQKGFAPYQQAISSLSLPSRGPKGDPKNLQRVAAVANALRGVFEKTG